MGGDSLPTLLQGRCSAVSPTMQSSPTQSLLMLSISQTKTTTLLASLYAFWICLFCFFYEFFFFCSCIFAPVCFFLISFCELFSPSLQFPGYFSLCSTIFFPNSLSVKKASMSLVIVIYTYTQLYNNLVIKRILLFIIFTFHTVNVIITCSFKQNIHKILLCRIIFLWFK